MTTHNTPDKQGEALERRKNLEARLASRQQNHRIVPTSDDGAPERIRLVKREGIFDGRWYYPDAAITPFDVEIQYVRASSAAVEGDAQAKRNDFNVTEWHKCFDRLMGTVPYSDEQPLRDEIKHASRVIDLLYKEVQSLRTAVASSPAPAEKDNDGWVTFGRVKVDIENETETFERISPLLTAASEGEQQ